MKKFNVYLLLIFTMLSLSFCRNNRASDTVDAAKESNDQKEVMNEDQSDFLVEATNGGMLEVEMGKLAQDKASHARVKAFGSMMVKDHTELNQEIKDLASKKQLTLPGSIASDEQDDLNKLRKLSGRDFDQEYMRMMVDDHEKDIKKFEDASENHKDSDVQTFAAKTLPKLRAHLDSAKMIRDAIRKSR